MNLNLTIAPDGLLSLAACGKERIRPSPAGILVHGGIAYRPDSAAAEEDGWILRYPCGDCRIRTEAKNGYFKLTLESVPDGTDAFLFGPYETGAASYGEVLGAGWYEDGSAVCIQSLMPKVEEGNDAVIRENRTDLPLPRFSDAAAKRDGKVILQCFVKDRTRPSADPDGSLMTVTAEEGEDAKIQGAAVALLAADSAADLLSVLGGMEIAEGLPHPLYRGCWAKTDPRSSSYYLILNGDLTEEERIAAAERAGVSSVYFDDVLDGWGHFTVNRNKFPGGEADLKAMADRAYESGVILGAHSLTNFLKTNDPYITPVPHPRLLVRDETELAADIAEDDTSVPIRAKTNYESKSTLNCFRIGDELLTFGGFDGDSLTLTDCVRGAFGTKKAAHRRGERVCRLVDHGYGVLFPDVVLADEVADSLGRLIRDCGIRRMSFDGLEGTAFTGHGNYARSKFVKRVFDLAGNELLSDGSNICHYLWHAFSYCNWGEPWYDSARRGGMPALRESHQEFFDRNLIPRMTGWYQICPERDRFEATPPENMEFLLSRAVAWDAGSALVFNGNHGLFGEYLDLVRLWGEFRREGDIPDEVRERMKDEFSNWHLEAEGDGWKLTELIVRPNDLFYCDRIVHTEAGTVGSEAGRDAEGRRIRHAPVVVWDRSAVTLDEPESVRFRIRVGEHGRGMMEDLDLYGRISFRFHADGGDYLVYDGGRELKHYDGNYRLLETLTGEGSPLTDGSGFIWGQLAFTTDDDPAARYIFTEIRKKRVLHIGRKAGAASK